MNKLLVLPLFILICFLSCTRISFMHSISDRNDEKLFKKEILGKWSSDSEELKDMITIDSFMSDHDGLLYSIKIFEKGESFELGDSSYLIGELFQLQGKFFMMVRSDFENKQLRKMGIYNMATMFPAFYVVRLFSIKDDILEIGTLDGDAFMELIKEKKISIKHEVIEENKEGEPEDVIVFEKSAELKKKLVELDKFPEVYERTVYHKIK